MGSTHCSATGPPGSPAASSARIGIARALLADPDVLVLDEPTAHLDHGTARAVSDTVLAARRGRSLLWITHENDGLAAMDAVLDLGAGRAAVPSHGRGRQLRG